MHKYLLTILMGAALTIPAQSADIPEDMLKETSKLAKDKEIIVENEKLKLLFPKSIRNDYPLYDNLYKEHDHPRYGKITKPAVNAEHKLLIGLSAYEIEQYLKTRVESVYVIIKPDQNKPTLAFKLEYGEHQRDNTKRLLTWVTPNPCVPYNDLIAVAETEHTLYATRKRVLYQMACDYL